MSFDEAKWVWMNGRCVRWDEATVHVSAHGLHYGSGVFEGVRCYETEGGPALFRLDAHLERLYYSASVYGMEIPYTREELEEAVCETVARNEFRSCYVRPICFYGSRSLGVNPHGCPVEVAVMAWPWGAYLGAGGQDEGVRVTVSPWLKFDSRMMPTTAKACGQYLNSMLAARDAASRGFAEALLLDAQGRIAEGSGENLFVVKGGRLRTNDERSSILLGVTRDAVMRLARGLGYEVETGALDVEDLRAADEVFFTGTAVEVTPVVELDGVRVGTGRRGAVTERIQRAFFDATSGRDERYAGWLRHVAAQPVSIF
ncbi:MAG TPA: branched-chain amino acid transaminase [Pyrinomonadaceae bacterium]|nr:branched-chain amino acid transaminase [Pyrinomonadaceae bacterium]